MVLPQVFKHEHATLYLRMGRCSWMISNTIDSPAGCILSSGSAGSVCPAHPSNRVNNKKGWRSWKYCGGTEWTAGEISVTCDTHEWHDSK